MKKEGSVCEVWPQPQDRAGLIRCPHRVCIPADEVNLNSGSWTRPTQPSLEAPLICLSAVGIHNPVQIPTTNTTWSFLNTLVTFPKPTCKCSLSGARVSIASPQTARHAQTSILSGCETQPLRQSSYLRGSKRPPVKGSGSVCLTA